MTTSIIDNLKIKVENSRDVFDVMQKVFAEEDKSEQDHEHMWVMGLNVKDRVCYVELMNTGIANLAGLNPMQVFKIAIYKGAVKLILIHNHPSHELTPSEEELDFTDRLIQVGKIVEIEINDHLIISPENYYSFEDSGVMEELKESKKWILSFNDGERIRREARKLSRMKVSKKARNTEGKKSHKKRR